VQQTTLTTIDPYIPVNHSLRISTRLQNRFSFPVTNDSVRFSSQPALDVSPLLVIPPVGLVNENHIEKVRQAVSQILTNSNFPPQLKKFLLTQSDLKIGFLPVDKSLMIKSLAERKKQLIEERITLAFTKLKRALNATKSTLNNEKDLYARIIKAYIGDIEFNQAQLNKNPSFPPANPKPILRKRMTRSVESLALFLEPLKNKNLFKMLLKPHYDPILNLLLIPEQVTNPQFYKNRFGYSYLEVISSRNLLEKILSHELGHAIDSNVGYLQSKRGLPLHLESKFTSALEKEFDQFKNIKPFPIHSNLNMNSKTILENYFDEFTEETTDRFYIELWTELFNARYTNGGVLNANDLKQHFPKTILVIEKQINDFCASLPN